MIRSSLFSFSVRPSTNGSPEPKILSPAYLSLCYVVSCIGGTSVDLGSLKRGDFRSNFSKGKLQLAQILLMAYIAFELMLYGICGKRLFLNSDLENLVEANKLQLYRTDLPYGVKLFASVSTKLIITIVPATMMFSLMGLYFRTSHLTKFLEGWNDFEKFHRRTFHCWAEDEIQRPKPSNLLIGFVGLTISASAALWYSLFRTAYPSPAAFATQIVNYFSCGVFGVVTNNFATAMILWSHLQLSKAFNVIKSSIEHQVCQKTRSGQRISATEVKGWLDLVLLCREQCQTFNTFIKIHTLIEIWRTLDLVAVAAFIAITNFFAGGPSTVGTFFWQSFVPGQLAALWVRAWVAQRVTVSEAKLYKYFTEVPIAVFDQLGNVQFQLLKNHIRNDPCKVKFGTYCTLNTTLVLNVFKHAMTYLIVIGQQTQK